MFNSPRKNYARIFVAFPVTSVIAEELKIIRVQNNLLTGIRWTPSQNLHLTIFFLGEVPEENVSSISVVISAALIKTKPFSIEFDRITLAGKPKHGGMIWARFHKNDFY